MLQNTIEQIIHSQITKHLATYKHNIILWWTTCMFTARDPINIDFAKAFNKGQQINIDAM